MEDNIESIVKNIECSCGTSIHFKEILSIFADKIVKLRTERDRYKDSRKELHKEISSLKKLMEKES